MVHWSSQEGTGLGNQDYLRSTEGPRTPRSPWMQSSGSAVLGWKNYSFIGT